MKAFHILLAVVILNAVGVTMINAGGGVVKAPTPVAPIPTDKPKCGCPCPKG